MAVWDEPRGLSIKTGFTHFAAKKSLFPTPRDLGNLGIECMHHVYDRGVMWSVNRIHKQFTQVQYEQREEDLGEGESRMLFLTSFHVFRVLMPPRSQRAPMVAHCIYRRR